MTLRIQIYKGKNKTKGTMPYDVQEWPKSNSAGVVRLCLHCSTSLPIGYIHYEKRQM